jgi:hypothetical protein
VALCSGLEPTPRGSCFPPLRNNRIPVSSRIKAGGVVDCADAKEADRRIVSEWHPQALLFAMVAHFEEIAGLQRGGTSDGCEREEGIAVIQSHFEYISRCLAKKDDGASLSFYFVQAHSFPVSTHYIPSIFVFDPPYPFHQ